MAGTRLLIQCVVLGQLLVLVAVSMFVGFCLPDDVDAICRNNVNGNLFVRAFSFPQQQKDTNKHSDFMDLDELQDPPSWQAQVAPEDFSELNLQKAANWWNLELVPNTDTKTVCNNPNSPIAKDHALWICTSNSLSSPQHAGGRSQDGTSVLYVDWKNAPTECANILSAQVRIRLFLGEDKISEKSITFLKDSLLKWASKSDTLPYAAGNNLGLDDVSLDLNVIPVNGANQRNRPELQRTPPPQSNSMPNPRSHEEFKTRSIADESLSSSELSKLLETVGEDLERASPITLSLYLPSSFELQMTDSMIHSLFVRVEGSKEKVWCNYNDTIELLRTTKKASKDSEDVPFDPENEFERLANSLFSSPPDKTVLQPLSLIEEVAVTADFILRKLPLQLHFPLEHYAAIFAPLLFPLLLPFFVRLVKECRRHKEKSNKRTAMGGSNDGRTR